MLKIYMALRDKGLRKYKSSLLAVIQTNICKGPIFFNCYHDFMVDLTCPMTTEALKLDAHIQGNEFLDFKNFVVMYRIYFELISTNLNTRFLNPLPSNSQETILLQIIRILLKFRSVSVRENIEPSLSSNYRRSFSDAASCSEPLDHTTRYLSLIHI